MTGKYLVLKEPGDQDGEVIICNQTSGEVCLAVDGVASPLPYDIIWLTKFRPTLEVVEETSIWPNNIVMDDRGKNKDQAFGK